MGVKILTYEHTNELLYNPLFRQQYSNVLHITATSSLKSGLVQSVASGNRWITAPILSFGQLVPFIGEDWFVGKTELLQFMTLTSSLKRFTEQPTMPFNERIFHALDKDQEAVLRSLRTLIDAGITREAAQQALGQDISEEEQLALYLWAELEETAAYKRYQAWFANFNNEPANVFYHVIKNALLKVIEEPEKRRAANILPEHANEDFIEQVLNHTFHAENGLIIFHGFYFITPVQKRILDALARSANLTVVYLIQYNELYKETFETVEQFLNMRTHGYTKLGDNAYPVNHLAKRFINMIEGDVETKTVSKKPCADGKLFEFMHMYQFKSYVQHYPDELIISPRTSTAKKYMADLTSASDATLKDYPIGQFLIDLHRLNTRTFNTASKQYEDTDELGHQLLLRIFHSDYLMIGNESAKKYVPALQKLAPVVSGCVSLTDWQQSLANLRAQKIALEQTLTPAQHKADLEHDLYSYPNRALSYFNVSVAELDQIAEGIAQIRLLYNKLYANNSTSIAHYIEELQYYIDNNIRPKKQDQEQKLVQEVIDTLSSLKDDEFRDIDRKDLILGLRYFLSSTAKETSDVSEPVDNGSTHYDSIISLQDADKVPFLTNRFVHFAFMDNKALPLTQNLTLWPFEEQSIKRLHLIEGVGHFLQQIQLRKDLSSSITAYLMYVILQRATNAKFSVVKNFEDEHNLSPSFYIELLNLKRGFTDVHTTDDARNEQYMFDEAKKELSFNKRKNASLLQFTYDRCQKRFMLSFMLQNRPDFVSDFHQGFIYQNLLHRYRMLRHASVTKEQKDAFVASWFPQWTMTKKNMLRAKSESNLNKFGEEYKLYWVVHDGVRYADNQVNINLFGVKLEKTKSAEFANSGAQCKYCPFQLQCRESQFDVKEKEEED